MTHGLISQQHMTLSTACRAAKLIGQTTSLTEYECRLKESGLLDKDPFDLSKFASLYPMYGYPRYLKDNDGRVTWVSYDVSMLRRMHRLSVVVKAILRSIGVKTHRDIEVPVTYPRFNRNQFLTYKCVGGKSTNF
jgi:hypothetical protein